MLKKALTPIDNAPLVLFRIVFGFLFVCESFGAIATGWVKSNLVDVQMTFSHIYMDWLQPLPGLGMYFYFAFMGLVSIAVMLGYRYRWSMILLTLLWSGVYYMQKTSYNNHYYLMVVICIYMCFLPAHRYASLDVKQGRVKEVLAMPTYSSWILITQIALVYIYGTVAKFYPDWLDGTFVRLMYSSINAPEFFKEIFTEPWFYLTISYLGILYDGLIIPLLLCKRTRTWAVIASLVFHVFNSITLQIGVFPYFALSFALFFYDPEFIREKFLKKKPKMYPGDYSFSIPIWKAVFLSVFMLFQLLLPLRHYIIADDVIWTDEGHRLSWRMMLRSRSGYTYFNVVEKESGKKSQYPLEDKLSSKQRARLTTADMIWQMAQIIKKEYADKGLDVAVYADSWVSINGREYSMFIDDSVDLASVSWSYFGHNEWILPKPF
ncbi:HTTM domain-containing protein [Myroides guanonis]|uniref:Vitamin K-dependent gamma-carboxylase n=1 Tax=Myroides guanonis TaxID=1150112 RepID=A0A1I3T559_9FLAO|nr:HTTM domain-containing protein [Myroides guanonis]SFJ65760.1 Vitamin K-dependent gamma-carboxylase [Myroides guanonis]